MVECAENGLGERHQGPGIQRHGKRRENRRVAEDQRIPQENPRHDSRHLVCQQQEDDELLKTSDNFFLYVKRIQDMIHDISSAKKKKF